MVVVGVADGVAVAVAVGVVVGVAVVVVVAVAVGVGVGVVSASERAKGVRGEREVAELLRAHGFVVRGLEGSGDWLALGHGLTLHVECKRQEVARPWLWGAQALAECPPGAVPLVAFRRNRTAWWGLVPDLGMLLTAVQK